MAQSSSDDHLFAWNGIKTMYYLTQDAKQPSNQDFISGVGQVSTRKGRRKCSLYHSLQALKIMFFSNGPPLNGTPELLGILSILNNGECIHLIGVIKTNSLGI